MAAPSVPGLGQGEQRGHEALHVGDHTEVDRIIAADLLGVDVDVDEPRGWDRERVAGNPAAAHAVVEAGAERQQDVGLARGLIGWVRSIAADDPERQPMIGRHDARALRRVGDGDAEQLGEPAHLRSRLGQHGAVADEDHRPLGADEQLERAPRDLGRRRRPAIDLVPPLPWIGHGGRRRVFGEDVEWHVDVHGPRPPRRRRLERLSQRERQHLGTRHLEGALHVRADHGGKVRLVMAVRLLKGAAVELRRGHVPGDRDEGRGVHHRARERDGEVDRARATRRERRRRPMRHPIIRVGHVAGDLLVMDADHFDAIRALSERVHQADDPVAAQAEDVRHVLPHEILGDQIASARDGLPRIRA